MSDLIGVGQPSWLAAVGAVWDITGATILARGYLWATDEIIRKETASAYGMNPGAARSAAEERMNQRYGLALIICGFVMQAGSNAGITITAAMAGIAVLLIIPVVGYYLGTFQYQTVCDGLRISVVPDALERVWRAHHDDVPDRIWHAIIWNEGIAFAVEKEPS